MDTSPPVRADSVQAAQMFYMWQEIERLRARSNMEGENG